LTFFVGFFFNVQQNVVEFSAVFFDKFDLVNLSVNFNATQRLVEVCQLLWLKWHFVAVLVTKLAWKLSSPASTHT